MGIVRDDDDDGNNDDDDDGDDDDDDDAFKSRGKFNSRLQEPDVQPNSATHCKNPLKHHTINKNPLEHHTIH